MVCVHFRYDHSLAYIFLLLSVLLFGLLANVLLLATFSDNKPTSLRLNPSNMYICNMACTQVIATFSAVLTIDNVLQTWTTGQFTCKITFFILQASYQQVAFILLILHLQELIRLKHVKCYQRWSILKHWKKIMVITWLLILTCNTPQLFYQEVQRCADESPKSGVETLVCGCDHNSFSYKLHRAYTITLYIIKFLITLGLNIIIRRTLNFMSSNTTASSSTGGNVILLRKREYTLKTLSMLFILNFVLASPQIILEFFHDYEIPGSSTTSYIWLLVQFLYFSRYSCCSIAYIIMDKKCLQNAKEIVRCICLY
ncbi:QRFP-like peptide receptor [Dendronephthya gigantea]|uniref:QRFP-like peptide receptor n=1 Tax=Dendronephthya gigantea TaxID=151771 RepID=UPI00106A5FB0|nr:QRFP-like peptide receptor [Dendronephthya gigantea]